MDSDPRHLQLPADPMRAQLARRSVRVVLLMGLVVLLGLGDLHNTITVSHSIGMVEVNPIAAYLLSAESTLGLVLYKLGTMGVAVGLVLKIRRHHIGELGAWILALVMIGLTVYWHHYTTSMTAELANTGYHEIGAAMQAVASAAR